MTEFEDLIQEALSSNGVAPTAAEDTQDVKIRLEALDEGASIDSSKRASLTITGNTTLIANLYAEILDALGETGGKITSLRTEYI